MSRNSDLRDVVPPRVAARYQLDRVYHYGNMNTSTIWLDDAPAMLAAVEALC